MRKKIPAQKFLGQLDRVKAELDQLEKVLKTVDPLVPLTEVTAGWLKGILEARRRRDAVFGTGVFSDPGWDILLAAYALQLGNERGTITDVSRLSTVSYTTVLHWVGKLTRLGLLVQKNDEVDGRLVLLKLSERGVAAMSNYFASRERNGLGL